MREEAQIRTLQLDTRGKRRSVCAALPQAFAGLIFEPRNARRISEAGVAYATRFSGTTLSNGLTANRSSLPILPEAVRSINRHPQILGHRRRRALGADAPQRKGPVRRAEDRPGVLRSRRSMPKGPPNIYLSATSAFALAARGTIRRATACGATRKPVTIYPASMDDRLQATA